jgi:rRNA maturation endonuclease Nob1
MEDLPQLGAGPNTRSSKEEAGHGIADAQRVDEVTEGAHESGDLRVDLIQSSFDKLSDADHNISAEALPFLLNELGVQCTDDALQHVLSTLGITSSSISLEDT